MARAGGLALILASLLFMAVFAFLASAFDYPAILDRDVSEVLPRLLQTGERGRVVWSLYAFLPMLLIPAGLGAREAFGRVTPGLSRLAPVSATVCAIAMTLGLARWPSIHWRLAERYGTASNEQRAVIAGVFDGLNAYLGNFIGEFLGELALTVFFAVCAYGLLKSPRVSRWIAWAAVVATATGAIALFRNVTGVVAPIAGVNNIVLPVWLIVLGVTLVRLNGKPEPLR